MGSDALDKLRGRSRSGLPSPESEDISRRRDSRKGQKPEPNRGEHPPPAASSGLSSLAKIYADDGDKEEPGAPGVSDEEGGHPKISNAPVASGREEVVLTSQAKDNNHASKNAAADKDVSRSSGRDKQTVRKNNELEERTSLKRCKI